MAEKDSTERILESHADVFSDIVNVFLFHGERVVRAPDLVDKMVHSQYRDQMRAAKGKNIREQERDVLKEWRTGGVQLALLGLENQTGPQRWMPFRIIGYDGAAYRSQMQFILDERAALQKKKKQMSESEYREKREAIPENILPVLTLILHFGTETRWNCPRNIRSLMDIPEGISEYVNDYRIQVVDVAWMTEEEIDTLQSDFRLVAKFLRAKRLKDPSIMMDEQEITHADDLLKFFYALTGDNDYTRFLDVSNNEKESKNMCDILKAYIDMGREEGIAEGHNEGINLLSSLINKLIELGRNDEIPKVTTDGTYRDRLFAELAIK